MLPCTGGEVSRVVVSHLLAYAFLLEHASHLLTFQVYCRHHYVAGLLPQQLQDALAEVGLHHINAVVLQERVHAALFCEHRFRLHHLCHAMLLQYVEHRMVERFGILRPMHYDPSAFQLPAELFQIVGKMRYGVAFYRTGTVAQFFPFGQSLRHGVAFLAQRPECGVVPSGLFTVFVEASCSFRM